MIICSVKHISKMFGGHEVFADLSFQVKEGERVGLVGQNGCGKTTIFKLLTGSESPDQGTISFKKGSNVGCLAQIPSFPDEMNGYDVLKTAFQQLIEMEREMKELESKMGHFSSDWALQQLLEKYGVVQEQFSNLGGYEYEAKITKVAHGLEIQSLLEQPFTLLSGGEKTKIGLALILLQHPDLLLLDEPTNHLDITAIEWLSQYLSEYNGTLMVISHDRYFLDEVVTKILDLEDGEITVYHTNYSGFVKEKEERLLNEFHAYEEQQKKIKKMKEAIKRLREWANQAVPPNPGLHRRANSMEKALERMEKLKRPILERKEMGLQFESGNRSGKDVIVAKNLEISFEGRKLFEKVSFLIQFKEKVALVGRNGTGKSTILKLILKELEPDHGEVFVGSSVKVGYLSQHSTVTDPSATVVDAFREEIHVTEADARYILAKFLFYGHAVYRKVGQLSGGERMRLRLAQLMYQDINLLILDEPTNHLDIDSREVLEDALEHYQGTILAVSHDRYFINKLFQKTYWLENGIVYHFEGNYSWAKEKMIEIQEKRENNPTIILKEKIRKEKPPLDFDMQVMKLENQLEEIESIISHVEQKMIEETALKQIEILYKDKEEAERKRDHLYNELDTLLKG